MSLPVFSPPSARISLTYTVKMPWPRDERGFIAIAATTRLLAPRPRHFLCWSREALAWNFSRCLLRSLFFVAFFPTG